MTSNFVQLFSAYKSGKDLHKLKKEEKKDANAKFIRGHIILLFKKTTQNCKTVIKTKEKRIYILLIADSRDWFTPHLNLFLPCLSLEQKL